MSTRVTAVNILTYYRTIHIGQHYEQNEKTVQHTVETHTKKKAMAPMCISTAVLLG